MSELTLHIEGDRDTFKPGEKIEGIVEVNLAERPHKLVVQLVWATEGMGDADSGVAASQEISTTGEQPFSLARIIHRCWFVVGQAGLGCRFG